ncbi:DUF2599 domain-containing protein [Dietzia sp. 179-F 9C3 NHS]|uniref:DUF2599 domain-containing protein n=1 Tax=Dietzia sp. 179-F 9C3 NHS TaxID=3374295 RepID=UPI0038794B61
MRPHLLRPASATPLVLVAAAACAAGCAPDVDAPDAGPAAGAATSAVTSSSPPPPPSPLPPVVPVTPPSVPATATTTAPISLNGPYVASATWSDTDLGSTLRVAPTPGGRATQGPDDAATAWGEVLALAPDADAPGMWEQFACHWTWARLVEPDKPTWNLEPWRPVVDEGTMVGERCNPGGPEV